MITREERLHFQAFMITEDPDDCAIWWRFWGDIAWGITQVVFPSMTLEYLGKQGACHYAWRYFRFGGREMYYCLEGQRTWNPVAK